MLPKQRPALSVAEGAEGSEQAPARLGESLLPLQPHHVMGEAALSGGLSRLLDRDHLLS